MTEHTNRDSNGRWLKGTSSPNPAGRGRTNRQRISEKLLVDLATVWETHGESILEGLVLTASQAALLQGKNREAGPLKYDGGLNALTALRPQPQLGPPRDFREFRVN